MRSVLLLLPTSTYRAHDFLEAARELGVSVVVGSDRRQALEPQTEGTTVTLDFRDPVTACHEVDALHARRPLSAVVGADDETVVLAAEISRHLGLPANPPQAVRRVRDKESFRRAQRDAGLPHPEFALVGVREGPPRGSPVGFPCVAKPTFLSASRGVIRADDEAGLGAAWDRIAAILAEDEVRRRAGARADRVLLERYVPGPEVALEGLLHDGDLRVLALFDKPDPLEGPYFEETLLVTPSRHPAADRRAVVTAVEATTEAVGLRHGPVHAEVRLSPRGPVVVEVAARSIGGHCTRALRFGAGISLEELVLRHALGDDVSGLHLDAGAAGVMMIPIPGAGYLHGVDGIEAAREVPGVGGVEISILRGQRVVPLPEGHRYLGFLFATGDDAAAVEGALRRAHAALSFDIRAEAPA